MEEEDFVVAKCPDCGGIVSTEDIPQPMRLFIALAALMVTASHLENLMQLPEYAGIIDNWNERMTNVTSHAMAEASMMQDFGESFDEEA